MSLHVFHKSSRLPFPPGEVYDWHARPGALQRLSPPWEPVKLLEHTGGIGNGARAVLEVRLGPVPVRWVAEHRDCVPGRRFTDIQLEGPFARWEHTHRFEPVDTDASLLEDRVEYALPLEPASSLLSGHLVSGKLQRMFDFRHRVTARDLALHDRYRLGGSRRFVVSGASGLLGSNLCAVLSTGGHVPIALVRESSRAPSTAAGSVIWDPMSGAIDAERLEGADCVVHLAGESIASGRWSDDRRKSIRDSRVAGTRLLAETLASLSDPPETLICASATGWYGDRGDEPLTEQAESGAGFLADVCRDWEAAADPAREAGIRVVHLRFGMILWPSGGALKQMLPLFRAGAGGRIGSGRQFWSWISLDDAIGATLHAAASGALVGPVNVVSPGPVRNRTFVAVLGSVLNRPAVVPAPASVLRMTMGRMADELLLSSARVIPERLEGTGYEFQDPELEPALRHMLGRPDSR
jgi:uncharacterized protein (TIGR01777 family)